MHRYEGCRNVATRCRPMQASADHLLLRQPHACTFHDRDLVAALPLLSHSRFWCNEPSASMIKEVDEWIESIDSPSSSRTQARP
eukprot:scaffold264745_cov36-Tisochrysis_lutea.AAC.3